MAAMLEALRVHVAQRGAEALCQTESSEAALTDFLQQKLAPRMQSVATDPKATAKKRQIALQLLAVSHLAAQGGICL